MGHHLYAFLYQLIRKRNDTKFFEYLLHHSMAFFLIFFSYCTNLITSGIMVLLTHDISDAFLVLARGYGDFKYKNKKLVNAIYAIGFFVWCYTRLYAFPRCFIIPEILNFGVMQEKYKYFIIFIAILSFFRQVLKFVMGYLITMTCMLFIMHIYWSIFMIKAIFYSSVKNKIKVEYDLKDLKGNKMKGKHTNERAVQ